MNRFFRLHRHSLLPYGRALPSSRPGAFVSNVVVSDAIVAPRMHELTSPTHGVNFGTSDRGYANVDNADAPTSTKSSLQAPRKEHLSRNIHNQANSMVANQNFTPSAIAQSLHIDDIRADVVVSDKAELLDVIGQHMEHVHGLNHQWVTSALHRREMAGSTGLGQGIAIPHARVKELDHIQAAYFRLQSPIDFDAPDGLPVSHIVVLLVPTQAAQEHLQILADTTLLFCDRNFRQRLRTCRDSQDIQRLFASWPQHSA